MSESIRLVAEQPAELPRRRARPAAWGYIARELRAAWPAIAVATALLLAANICNLLLPLVLGRIIDSFQAAGQPADPALLNQQFGLLAALFVGQSLASCGQLYLASRVAEQAIFRLRMDLYEHVQRLPMAFYIEHRVSELSSRFTNDIEKLRALIASNALSLVRHGLVAAGALAVMLWLNWQLTILAFLSVFGMAVAVQSMMRRLRGSAHAAQQQLAEANGLLEETLMSIAVVRAFVREGYELARVRQAFQGVCEANLRRERQQLTLLPLSNGIAFGSLALLLWYGAQQIIGGTATAGDLIAYLAYAGLLAASLAQLSQLLGRLSEGLGSLKGVNALLELAPASPAPGATAAAADAPLRGRIALSDVTLQYAGQPAPALAGISLVAEPGEVIAVVGPSGSGKSSLAHLLLGLYPPQAGTITIDDTPLTEPNLPALRAQIGAVLQDTALFTGSVADNIRYGCLEASAAAVEAAARRAGAHEFIAALPDGYATRVGQRGAALSAGQRQRICIARMFLKQPALVILDEATSALDSDNERLIQAALTDTLGGRTMLIIAHRLSTVQHANRIVVLDQGQIAESGTHEALLQRGGLYARLYQQQQLGAAAG